LPWVALRGGQQIRGRCAEGGPCLLGVHGREVGDVDDGLGTVERGVDSGVLDQVNPVRAGKDHRLVPLDVEMLDHLRPVLPVPPATAIFMGVPSWSGSVDQHHHLAARVSCFHDAMRITDLIEGEDM